MRLIYSEYLRQILLRMDELRNIKKRAKVAAKMAASYAKMVDSISKTYYIWSIGLTIRAAHDKANAAKAAADAAKGVNNIEQATEYANEAERLANEVKLLFEQMKKESDRANGKKNWHPSNADYGSDRSFFNDSPFKTKKPFFNTERPKPKKPFFNESPPKPKKPFFKPTSPESMDDPILFEKTVSAWYKGKDFRNAVLGVSRFIDTDKTRTILATVTKDKVSVRKAYYALMLIFHPDKLNGISESEKLKYIIIVKVLNAAKI